MASHIFQMVREAIVNKAQIVATYRGYRREMCPHVLGTKNGDEQALFYQFAGGSSSGLGPPQSPQNWRCMFLKDLSGVTVRSGPWYTAPNHSRPQTCVDRIHAEVAF